MDLQTSLTHAAQTKEKPKIVNITRTRLTWNRPAYERTLHQKGADKSTHFVTLTSSKEKKENRG